MTYEKDTAFLPAVLPPDRGALLILCGGRRGGRLTPDEMKTLQRVTRDMACAYTGIETLYESLGRQMPEGDKHSLETFFEAIETWLGFYDEVRAFVSGKQADVKLQRLSAQPRADPSLTKSPSAECMLLFPAWLSTLMRLYRIEQKHPPESSPARGCAGTSPPTSKPLEGATALSISHNEHEREESPAACDDSPQRKNDAVRATTAAVVPGLAPEDDHKHWPKASANAGPNLAASPPLFSVDSLAKFTRFLSLLVVASEEERAAFTTERERSALGELLSASYDGSDRPAFVADSPRRNDDTVSRQEEEMPMPAPVASAPQAPAPTPPPAQAQTAREGQGTPPAAAARPLRYWARRLHRFLLSVRELQSVPERTDSSLEKALSESFSVEGKRRRRGQSPRERNPTSCRVVPAGDEGEVLFPLALPPLVIRGEPGQLADGEPSLEG